MEAKLIEYNGSYLNISEIAKKENLKRQTLTDWYNKTNDIYEAINGLKESLKTRQIKYKGKILSLKKISEIEKLKFETLKKYFLSTNNIYTAIKLTTESKQKREGNIEYKGKKRTITNIAKLENIDRHSLQRYYDKTNDIEESIRLTKLAKDNKNGTILYKNKHLTLTAIAKLEDIKKETLKKYYEAYQNIEKAVLITKLQKEKRKESILKNKKTTLEEASNELNISTIRLTKMMNDGITLDEIDKKIKENNRGKKDNYININETTLFKYCLENKLNYSVIYNIIVTYNKTPEEAISEYIKNGQSIPNKWIYEKYNILLKHLFITFGIDSSRIVKTMKNNNCSLEQALEKIIFISYNNNDFKPIEIEWLYELYTFLKECNETEYEEAKKTFYITEKEIELLKEKQNKINKIKKQLLLYEFSEVLDTWDTNTLLEMFELYNITKKDIETIIFDLYLPFEGNIINPNVDILNRKKYINNLIKNTINNSDINILVILDTLNLTDKEKKYFQEKREILKELTQSNNVLKKGTI